MKITAIITAAGGGKRFGGGKNKLLMNLRGKPVIARTIECFQKNKNINNIIVTGSADTAAKYRAIIKRCGFNKAGKVVAGGDTRGESVYNALKEAADSDYVLIHDGARPLVGQEIINNVIRGAKKYGAAIPAVAPKDTVKAAKKNGTVAETVDRNKLRMAQTPQGFKTELILKDCRGVWQCALAKNNKTKITDDASIVELRGGAVKIVPGSYENIKITTPVDLIIAEAILINRDREQNQIKARGQALSC